MPESLKHRPRFTPNEAAQTAAAMFGIRGVAMPLPSERDQNFRIRGTGAASWILKFSNADERLELLDLQAQLLDAVHRQPRRFHFPELVPTLAGERLGDVHGVDGRRHRVRLLRFLPGKPLAETRPHSATLLREFGELLGTISRGLESFSHPAARRQLKWDLTAAPVTIRERLALIESSERRSLVEHLLADWERMSPAHLGKLRRSVIHNDANDHNVLCGELIDDDRSWRRRPIVGLIDFGDAIEGWTVAELAIGMAYAMLGKADPVAAAAAMTAGYHAVFPLLDDEIAALVPLATMRLCLSVCISAEQRPQAPDDEYLTISETPAWEALERLRTIAPELAHCRLRHACGLEPRATAPAVRRWLHANRGRFAAVIEPPLDDAYVFDLSVGSVEMGGGEPGSFAAAEVTDNLFGRMRRDGAEVGVGRYDEARCWYGGELFAAPSDQAPRRRTVHLGIDLFLPAGAPVFAPLKGRIVGSAVNAGRLDYGPTLVLEHEPAPGIRFFTLYGHLDAASIQAWSVGDTVGHGDRLAAIGDYPDNGDWVPHLHFQVIADMLGETDNFAGVAAPDEREVWLSLCPDPNLILGIPDRLLADQRRSKQDLLSQRQALFGRSLRFAYQRPLQIVRGFAQTLYDEQGQPYLDAVNNVAHVGHAHPAVVAAANTQNALLNTNTRYLHDNLVEYAERLVATLPDPLRVCFLVCSGSEANELAVRLARTHTGRRDVVVLDGAYHGNTSTLIDLSPYKHGGPGGSGPPPWVHVAAMPDPYRGRRQGEAHTTGEAFAQHVRVACGQALDGVAAFLAEPLLGCGGQVVPPPGYLNAAFGHARAAGAVCIADEVQVGLGRVGSHFWAFESQGVVPDIVTLGKPIGNGYPVAAVVTSVEIAASFDNGMEYFNTFGGNPVAAAAGLAVLDVIEREELQENARVRGERLLVGLQELMRHHTVIGDVRGLGLYLGAELVVDRDTREPAPDAATYVINRMREHGILLSTDGPLHNVLKIKPPLCFSAADADRLLATLDRILNEDAVH